MPGPQTIAETVKIEIEHCNTLLDILAYARDRESWNRAAGHVFAERRYARIRVALAEALRQLEPEP